MRAITDATAAAALRPRRFVDNAALGMALFVFTEVMLFSGFLSAFAIVKGGAVAGIWPPPDQPRLPIERTALNTLALLLSGVALYVAGRRHARGGAPAASPWVGAALALGATFVVLQGYEWIALLGQGLTLRSSQLGSFFYVIVGTHALHAVAAIVVLTSAWVTLRAGRLRPGTFGAVRMFWYFVVLVWPALYWTVYL